MEIKFSYGNDDLILKLPNDCQIYKSNYRLANLKAEEMLQESIAHPVSSDTLPSLLQNRKQGEVVIVVSDITRPIPYYEFLPKLIAEIKSAGVKTDEITVLVATGMHRASTHEEQLKMFGKYIVKNYRIINHDCQNENELIELDGLSWSGSKIKLNKYYVQAGFRIVTGLVEPHFMAGYSGGRKAICPGLVALEAVRKFHGYQFLSHPNASSTVLKDNPCHDENSSIARMCPPDFTINVVLDKHKKVNAIISGELIESHLRAIDYVKAACCPDVVEPADLVITSSGGYPLDATFYQCVKGFVNCLPAVKPHGEIISFGSCMEGIGSPEYTELMKKYSKNYLKFIEDIETGLNFVKDQWQLQMQIRTLTKVGQPNLHFYTSGISQPELSLLFVNPHSISADQISNAIQDQIDNAVKAKKRIGIFPEGPYCSPIPK
ncbi:MAG: nickel-dependent lactate racemase [Prolixibacteraceae bacterium]|jgi:nickel-dependent lactate racemase|nr:nickel-dependent lactate racemase [Prolixibacteraceae bacterium]